MKATLRNEEPVMGASPSAAQKHYYEAAKSWDTDVVRHAQVARNRAYLFAGLSWTVSIVMAIALVTLVMREKIEVVTIAYNNASETVGHVRYSVEDAKRLTGLDAVRKFHINQWITSLETWSYGDIRQRGTLLNLYASPTLKDRLPKFMEGTAEDRALGPKLERVVKVSSISLLKDGLAHVQFLTEDYVDNAPTGRQQNWAAIVEFRFTHQPTSGGDLLNPFGFQVINYRRDAATVQ